MDHLPTPPKPAHASLRIPYLHGPVYDNLGFADYPERMGWDGSKLCYRGPRSLTGRPRSEEEAFLQSWLYFGVLLDALKVCGVPVHVADFLCDGDGSLLSDVLPPPTHRDGEDSKENEGQQGVPKGGFFITTRKLYSFLDEATVREKAQSKEQQGVHFEHIHGLLEKAAVIRQREDFQDQSERESLKFPDEFSLETPWLTPEIGLAMDCLYSTLYLWNAKIHEKEDAQLTYSSPRPRFLMKMLIHDLGWCPKLVMAITATSGSTVLHYSMMLENSDEKSHRNCSLMECVANSVEKSTYVTRHTCADWACEFLSPNIDEMRSILEDGNYPLVAIKKLNTEKEPFEIKVVPYDSSLPYIAISHVYVCPSLSMHAVNMLTIDCRWSDGFGNPHQNSLPLCIMSNLAQAIFTLRAQMAGGGGGGGGKPEDWAYFWMDTLCVPLSSTHAKKAAIKRMRATYTNAAAVLVIDRAISRQSIETAPEELLLRIKISTWMQRLWTLQEGMLNPTVWFCLRDGMCTTAGLARKMLEASTRAWNDPVTVAALQLYVQLNRRSSHLFTAEPEENLYNIAKASRSRSTSVASDEAICLATLLDMNVARILDAPDSGRMQEFYLAQQKVSPRIIFHPTQNKINTEGFRWAPATLLETQNDTVLEATLVKGAGQTDAVVTPAGLLLTYDSLLLGKTKKPISRSLWIRESMFWQPAKIVGIRQRTPEITALVQSSLLSMLIDWRIPYVSSAIIVCDCRKENSAEYDCSAKYVCTVEFTWGLQSESDEKEYKGLFEEAKDDDSWEKVLKEAFGVQYEDGKFAEWTDGTWMQGCRWLLT